MLDKEKRSILLMHGYFNSEMFEGIDAKDYQDVFVLEGRPHLHSAKATVKELLRRSFIPTIIADSMAGFLFYRNLIKEVRVSYFTPEKRALLCPVGGLILSVLGKQHRVAVNMYPGLGEIAFMGKQKDILNFNGTRIAPKGIKGYVPLVEWVPKKYVSRVYKS